jgi:hypothetical protein
MVSVRVGGSSAFPTLKGAAFVMKRGTAFERLRPLGIALMPLSVGSLKAVVVVVAVLLLEQLVREAVTPAVKVLLLRLAQDLGPVLSEELAARIRARSRRRTDRRAREAHRRLPPGDRL